MSKLDFFQRLDIYDINGDTVSKKTFNAIKELQEQNKILREALEFYAPEKDWHFYCDCCADGTTKLEKDHGKLAREALAKVEE